MKKELSTVYLAQHGETEWSLSGQYMGTSERPLTGYSEHRARRLDRASVAIWTLRLEEEPSQGEAAGKLGLSAYAFAHHLQGRLPLAK